MGSSEGWLGGAKMSFILRHRGAQLILAYSWAWPAILVAGKGRGGCFYFFCFFTFIPVPLSSLSLSFISSTISSIFFLPFSGRRHKMTHKGWRVVKPQLNQSWDHRTNSKNMNQEDRTQGPVVQSIVSLTSSLRVISLTVLADLIYNILIRFAEKMWVVLHCKSYSHFFSKKFQHICVSM